ncbi:MAG TPA: 4Fe-4S dicluster domain-containing protein [Blastocatellia bacterium]|jgi:molybdopterin-containing oxidoreductase family iron-sulfur binding subunit
MTDKATGAKEKDEAKPIQWGMVIDLDRCTGCEACVVACRAENNIAIAGDDESERGRSINWIRVERYFEGEYPNIRARFMPVMCQHCDEAPCEPVCPVYATYHTEEGLNAQVYNRCVGTRYCANNCPYTVRFFNFFDQEWAEPLSKAWNPEVSVRSKGVMEKCTFCVQRIRKGEDKARDEGREVKDGDVVPACVQSCPAKAMAFGNLADPKSEVSRLSKSHRASRLMEDLGTKPRVIYLNKGD